MARIQVLAIMGVLASCAMISEVNAQAGTVPTVRDAAAGAGYSSAGPRSCPTRNVPARGALSAAQAAAYVICGRERELAGVLHLVGNITVSGIAPGRRYNPREDNNVPNIDVKRPVYQIRGRLEVYYCNRTNNPYPMGPNYARGTNCNVIDHPNATGLCYQDSFGAWDCKLWDINARWDARVNVPPPS